MNYGATLSLVIGVKILKSQFICIGNAIPLAPAFYACLGNQLKALPFGMLGINEGGLQYSTNIHTCYYVSIHPISYRTYYFKVTIRENTANVKICYNVITRLIVMRM